MGGVTQPQRSFYDEVGGHDTFHAIVSRFYALVREDEILRPLYPEDELDAAEERLRMFLEQYWGGPRTYSDQRGHPRLRMRHSPFRIGFIERDAWLRCMHTAVASIDSRRSTTSTARNCWPIWRWPRTRWSTRRSRPSQPTHEG